MPTAEDIDDQLAQIRDLQNQIAGVPAPPIAAVNNRIQRDFQAQKARRIAILNGKAQDLNRQRAALPKPAAPKTDAQRQLEQQRAQTMEDRDQKKVDAIAGQKPQEELAKSRIEQQKENAGTSKVALGAGNHSLADLLATGSQRYDPVTGNVTFTIPNDKGTVTPQQKAAGVALNSAFIKSTPFSTPEAVFGADVPPPVFKADGSVDTKASTNPFGGNQGDYNALKVLYERAQPTETTDIAVPKGVFEKTYLDAVPKYGPTFPDNPVATEMLDDRSDARARAFANGDRDESDFNLARATDQPVPVVPNAAGRPAAPIPAVPIEPAMPNGTVRPFGLNTGVTPDPFAYMRSGATPPTSPLALANQDLFSAGAGNAPGTVPLPTSDVAAAKVASIARQTGIPEARVSQIFAATPDPAVQKQALDDERSQISTDALPGQVVDAAYPIAKYAIGPGGVMKAADLLSSVPSALNSGLQSIQDKVDAQRKLDAAAREARGLPPLDETVDDSQMMGN